MESAHALHCGGGSAEGLWYLTELKLQKFAQPVSVLLVAEEEELQATSAGVSVEEDTAAELVGLAGGAEEVPVSIGMSSKLAVQTGPAK